MDYQFWIWLIIIVLTFVARARKQKAKPQPQQEKESWQDEKPTSRPLTFDELLKEIQQAKTPRAPEVQPARPYNQLPPQPTTFQEVDYDDNLGDEEQDLEKIPARGESKSTEIYETAKREAFSRPSLEETMKLEDTIVRFSQFKGYESLKEKAPMADFFAEIHDPEGFKKAFIMSEILTRKV